MTNLPPIDPDALEAFRKTLPEEDQQERRFDGVLQWDVVKARYLVAHTNRQPRIITVANWKSHLRFSQISEEHVERVDLSKPLIIVELVNDFGQIEPRIIDGTHRLSKADRQGVAQLPAYFLTVEEGLLCRIWEMPLG